MANRLTEDSNTSPDIIKYFGGPICFMDFNSTTVSPSYKQRFNNSAHPYAGLHIADKVHVHDTVRNNLTKTPDDKDA